MIDPILSLFKKFCVCVCVPGKRKRILLISVMDVPHPAIHWFLSVIFRFLLPLTEWALIYITSSPPPFPRLPHTGKCVSSQLPGKTVKVRLGREDTIVSVCMCCIISVRVNERKDTVGNCFTFFFLS